MKKFASGLIIGTMITVSMSVFADNIVVKENPFPIMVDGARQAIGAYNINGSTYLKLKDVAKVTEGAVNVSFDGEKQVINIDTIKNELPKTHEQLMNNGSNEARTRREPIPKEIDYNAPGVMLVDTQGLLIGEDRFNDEGYLINKFNRYEYWKDGVWMTKHDGKEYGSRESIGWAVSAISNDYIINYNYVDKQVFAYNATNPFEKLLIPSIEIHGSTYIEMDYYYNTILPFLE